METPIDHLFPQFAAWVDETLLAAPPDAAAFCFNLYEHEDAYGVQLVATTRFDRDDPAWAVDPILLTSEEQLFLLERQPGDTDWERALEEAKFLVGRYLNDGQGAATLLRSQGLGCGFVDGDVSVLWPPA